MLVVRISAHPNARLTRDDKTRAYPLCFVKTGRLVSHLYLCSCLCKAWWSIGVVRWGTCEDWSLEIFPLSLVIRDSIQRWKYSCPRAPDSAQFSDNLPMNEEDWWRILSLPGRSRAGKTVRTARPKWPSKFTFSFVFLSIRIQFG